MTRFRKIYLEISNICNLNCTFCPKHRRTLHAMDEAEFPSLLSKLRPYSDFLYFHLMGEPLLHPKLKRFLELAGNAGFKVILTTNGTLISKQQDTLLRSPALHKVNISLHSFEANDAPISFTDYLDVCFSFGKAAEGKHIVVYRLWNQGGSESRNPEILAAMEAHFPKPWKANSRGFSLGNRVFLEYGDKFDWPDLSAPETDGKIFCYGLRDQIGVLCDGTVVPCCLDHEGDIPLGNLHQQSMEEILNSPRARAIYQGFQSGNAPEELCRKCGYAQRFK